MTVELCTSSCKANGFRYAGLEYYGECFCGDAVNGPPAGSESDCSFACTGDKSEVCGGFDYVSIYQDTTFTPVNTQTIADYLPLGCYSEGTNGRAISFQQNSVLPLTMTTEICLQACKNEGYPFAATEFASHINLDGDLHDLVYLINLFDNVNNFHDHRNNHYDVIDNFLDSDEYLYFHHANDDVHYIYLLHHVYDFYHYRRANDNVDYIHYLHHHFEHAHHHLDYVNHQDNVFFDYLNDAYLNNDNS
ncbi:hypothetical protein MMC32_003421 [Xylographa parallela]|nr:hypothetical protein [Xylographa parallela]